MTALGLGDGMRFVIYDVQGLFAAARVWWTLRVYGVGDVRILEGGLSKWIGEGRPLEAGEAHPKPRPFTPRLDESLIASLAEVREGAGDGVGAGRRRPSRRAVPGRSARAAARSQGRPYARQPQRALRRRGRARTAEAGAKRSAPCSPSTRSISQSPSSPPAARASARRSWRSPSRRRAAGSPGSTTARGPNGADGTIARRRPGLGEHTPPAKGRSSRGARTLRERGRIPVTREKNSEYRAFRTNSWDNRTKKPFDFRRFHENSLLGRAGNYSALQGTKFPARPNTGTTRALIQRGRRSGFRQVQGSSPGIGVPSPLVGEGQDGGRAMPGRSASLARSLRRNATSAERRLWQGLRRKEVGGFRFRRQVPLGGAIADFASFDARLIIEVDGRADLFLDRRRALPATRRAQPRSRHRASPYLRFTNDEVFRNLDGVLETIRLKLMELRPRIEGSPT